MPPRFYAPDAIEGAERVALPLEEAEHLTRVLRLRVGDVVRVFDGRGREWQAVVRDTGKRGASVAVQQRVNPAPESQVAITLAVAVLKGDQTDHVVRDAVALGVTEIQPLITARTWLAQGAVERSGRRARWQRVAISSAKQCGRAVVPVVHPVRTFEEVLTEGRDVLMFVEPQAGASVPRLQALTPRPRATVAIGPEGGWTRDEVNQATTTGATPVTLGTTTLRAELAPLVAVVAVRTAWGDL